MKKRNGSLAGIVGVGLAEVLFGLILCAPSWASSGQTPQLRLPEKARASGGVCNEFGNRRACQRKSRGGELRVAVDASLKSRDGFRAYDKGSDAGQVFAITSAKKVRIRFLGYKELTGEYSINADATVSIPVLGRISVARMDAARLERILSQKVTALTGRKGYATVEIISYRSIFVSGTVKKPQSYAWTPGMTVLQAVTLAGGANRLVQGSAMNIPLSANAERARLSQATNNMKRAIARIARLRAERLGKSELLIPPRLSNMVGKAEAARLIAAQAEVLKSNVRAFNNQSSAIRHAISTAKGELRAMVTQGQLIKRQIKLRQQHRKKMLKLKKRRLISGTAILELETKIAEAEEKNISAMVARARLQGRLLDLQREMLGIRQKREGALEQSILELERDIAEQDIKLITARRAINALGGDAGSLDGGSDLPRKTSFQIVRNVRGGARTFKVDQFTRLRPGDIVVVSKQ